MVRPLIRFGMRQAVLMNLVFIGVVLFAWLWAIPHLPVDRYPNFSFGEVTITVPYPGASAADVERLVTKRIEDAIRGMDDLEFVKSTSIQGRAEIQVKFDDDTDYQNLYEELRLRVLTAQNQLPTVNGEPLAPRFEEVETNQWLPVLQVDLFAADFERPLAKRELTLLARELQTRIEQLPGIKRVVLWGDEAQQYVVALDPERLRRSGVALEQVARALQEAGISLPAGRLSTSAGERLIRVDGRYRTAADIEAVPVRLDGTGAVLTVGDLLDPAESGVRRFDDAVIATVNGRDSVSCRVVKDRAADARTVKAAVLAEVERFATAHIGDRVKHAITMDSTVAIDDSIDVLTSNIVQGTVLVLTIQALFLGLRSAAITISGLTFSVLGTLIWFWAVGSSLNELSLLGFVIAVGILVDDEVVILDNIQRHRDMGKPLAEAAVDGTVEVFWPLVTGTMTNVAGFLPLFLMTGIVGEFFALVPQAVAVSLLISLVEVVLLVPLHVIDLDKWFGPPKPGSAWGNGLLVPRADGHGLVAAVYRGYDRLVDILLRRSWIAFAGTGLLFVLAVMVLLASAYASKLGIKPLVRLEFFPSDAAAAEIRVTLPDGSPLAETDRVVRAIASDLAERGPGSIRAASGLAGLQVDTTYKPVWGAQYGFITAELASRDQRTFDDPSRHIIALRDELKARHEVGGVRVEVQAQQGGPPTGRPISVRLGGLDEQAISAAAADLKTWLADQSAPDKPMAGVIEVSNDSDRRNVVVSFIPDRRRLAEFAVSEADAQRFIAALHEGVYVGEYRRTDEDIPLKVRLARATLLDGSALGDVAVRQGEDGRAVRYLDLGQVSTSEEPAQIVRRDYVRTITVSAGLDEDTSLNAFTAAAEIRTWFDANAARYPGVVLAFGGEAESTGRSYASLTMAFVVAVFSIYVLLAMQFNSFLQPLLILSNIVFSFTGVVLMMGLFGGMALLLGESVVRPERALFTVNSFIAIVALTGMVTNNAIVLIDFINTRVRDGLPLETALREAGHLRLRPIVLTTITTIVGLLPTAIGIPEYNLTWSPMATAFCAGLTLSTILTLLVVPVLYGIVERHRALVGWIFGGVVAAAVATVLVLRHV